MGRHFGLAVLALFFATTLRAGLTPHAIPRNLAKQFSTDGLFEGGSDAAANIESMRLAQHGKQGFERWVIDFSDGAKSVGLVAPRFQLRYERAEKIPLPEGGDLVRKPARFIFVFRQIQKNLVNAERIQELLKKSRHVKDIILYPPIEKGDMAMEFVLKDNVAFTPHQPLEREGRLVLDLKTIRP